VGRRRGASPSLVARQRPHCSAAVPSLWKREAKPSNSIVPRDAGLRHVVASARIAAAGPLLYRPCMNLAGKFIVIDGPDGCGKGTQLERLAAWIGTIGGHSVRAKDPGGTVIGDRVRHVLLGYDLSEMDPRCETLLFMASRAQLVAEVIRPALAAGKTVLGDRYISSTCAYQVAAGFPRDDVIALGKLAVGDVWPELTIVLDIPPELGFERTGRKPHHVDRRRNHAGQLSMFDGATADAMERRPLEFHRRIRTIFRELPTFYPRPVVVLDGQPVADVVFAEVQKAVTRAFP
jgi:dTMP kinase